MDQHNPEMLVGKTQECMVIEEEEGEATGGMVQVRDDLMVVLVVLVDRDNIQGDKWGSKYFLKPTVGKITFLRNVSINPVMLILLFHFDSPVVHAHTLSIFFTPSSSLNLLACHSTDHIER